MDGLKFEERLESSAKDVAESVPIKMPASVGRLQMTLEQRGGFPQGSLNYTPILGESNNTNLW